MYIIYSMKERIGKRTSSCSKKWYPKMQGELRRVEEGINNGTRAARKSYIGGVSEKKVEKNAASKVN